MTRRHARRARSRGPLHARRRVRGPRPACCSVVACAHSYENAGLQHVVTGRRGEHRRRPCGRRRGSAAAGRRARARSTRRCSACTQQLADGVAQPPALRAAVGASSTNGRRIQLSTFSCTTSLDSAKLAAASAGSSARGIGARPRALDGGAGQQRAVDRRERRVVGRLGRGAFDGVHSDGPRIRVRRQRHRVRASASAAAGPGPAPGDAGRVLESSSLRLPARAALTQTGRLVRRPVH